MLKSFQGTIQKYNMLSGGEHVIVGVSGGADSMLLLTLLMGLRGEYGLAITAAHVNHGIRGAEADGDEAFVREYCGQIGAHFAAFHENAPKEAETLGLGLEEAGREIRYRCFNKALAALNADKIAIAHNSNDNAETVFMRICRGAGLHGLCGIPPARGPIIRPLIETSRAEIERYLHERGIPYRTDSSNLSDNYTRNRVRNRLIPEISSALGVDLCEKLNSLSRLCGGEEDFLAQSAQMAYKNASAPCENGVSLSIPALQAAHPAIAARVVRLALAQWGLKDISNAHAQAIRKLMAAQSGKEVMLPGGVAVKKNYGELHFSIQAAAAQPFLYALRPNEPLFVPELSRYFLLSEKSVLTNARAVYTKPFLYDKMIGVQIRSRLPGDGIRIRHIGAVSLKKYFINNKTPQRQRGKTGLIAQGGEVVWILDGKNICHEHYEALGSSARKIYIHVWEG